jgi:hypothetical protein
MTILNILSNIDFFAAIIAAIGLFFTAYVFLKDEKTKQLQIAEGIFKDIRDLENQYYVNYYQESEYKKKNWSSIFFNTLEWFSFLINNRKLNDKEMIYFFKDAIIIYYEDIFCKIYDAQIINDNTQFPEFKQLYKKLKEISTN